MRRAYKSSIISSLVSLKSNDYFEQYTRIYLSSRVREGYPLPTMNTTSADDSFRLLVDRRFIRGNKRWKLAENKKTINVILH